MSSFVRKKEVSGVVYSKSLFSLKPRMIEITSSFAVSLYKAIRSVQCHFSVILIAHRDGVGAYMIFIVHCYTSYCYVTLLLCNTILAWVVDELIINAVGQPCAL